MLMSTTAHDKPVLQFGHVTQKGDELDHSNDNHTHYFAHAQIYTTNSEYMIRKQEDGHREGVKEGVY